MITEPADLWGKELMGPQGPPANLLCVHVPGSEQARSRHPGGTHLEEFDC